MCTKALIVLLFLSTLGTSLAAAFSPGHQRVNPWPKQLSLDFLQSPVDTQHDHSITVDDGDSGQDDIATLQGVFNVLAQIETEREKLSESKTAAKTQLVKGTITLLRKVGKGLLKKVKAVLRKKYCSSEEQQMRAMLQELVGEQGMVDEDFDDDDEDTGDGDTKAIAELQTIFSALKKADAKMMGGDANAEGWWKKVKGWVSKKLRGITRKYLC